MFYFNPETQQKIKIEEDEVWGKVVAKAAQDFFIKKLPISQITLFISNPLKKGFRSYEESNIKNSQLFNYSMSNQ